MERKKIKRWDWLLSSLYKRDNNNREKECSRSEKQHRNVEDRSRNDSRPYTIKGECQVKSKKIKKKKTRKEARGAASRIFRSKSPIFYFKKEEEKNYLMLNERSREELVSVTERTQSPRISKTNNKKERRDYKRKSKSSTRKSVGNTKLNTTQQHKKKVRRK